MMKWQTITAGGIASHDLDPFPLPARWKWDGAIPIERFLHDAARQVWDRGKEGDTVMVDAPTFGRLVREHMIRREPNEMINTIRVAIAWHSYSPGQVVDIDITAQQTYMVVTVGCSDLEWRRHQHEGMRRQRLMRGEWDVVRDNSW